MYTKWMKPMPPPPRIRAREFQSSAELQEFVAMSCGTDDVGLTQNHSRHYSEEDWCVDIVKSTLRGCARSALSRSFMRKG